jgi:hypothetical protein
MKYAVQIDSDAMIYIPRFIKGGYTDTQTGKTSQNY